MVLITSDCDRTAAAAIGAIAFPQKRLWGTLDYDVVQVIRATHQESVLYLMRGLRRGFKLLYMWPLLCQECSI